jgi:transcriptional repressor NrdR
MIIKRDGRREPFDNEKLERKILLSLTKRPVSRNEVDRMLQEIEDAAAMQSKGTHELSSRDLGEIVLRALFEIDRVAYVRFASVYRMYDNVGEFIREIERLSKKALSEGERRQLQFHWEGNK